MSVYVLNTLTSAESCSVLWTKWGEMSCLRVSHCFFHPILHSPSPGEENLSNLLQVLSLCCSPGDCFCESLRSVLDERLDERFHWIPRMCYWWSRMRESVSISRFYCPLFPGCDLWIWKMNAYMFLSCFINITRIFVLRVVNFILTFSNQNYS
jgi:hypothetical protein